MSSSSQNLVPVEKLFWGVLTALSVVVASTFGYVALKMDVIAGSVVELNTKIAVVLAKGTDRDEKINDHELRLRDMEKNTNR